MTKAINDLEAGLNAREIEPTEEEVLRLLLITERIERERRDRKERERE
jgi:hypothetical protein